MRYASRKSKQQELAEVAIDDYFNLLESSFYPAYNKFYVDEIVKLAQGFNIRLGREKKLKFCKKCHALWTVKTREIRMNAKTRTKEYICKECGFVRRFKY